jgi:hypothetical protein
MTQTIPEEREHTKSIEEALRRPTRHWNMDGLPELLAGLWLLGLGSLVVVQQLWPSRLTTLLAAILPCVFGVGFAVFHRAIQRGLESLKERWTYPRVGYMKMREPSPAARAAAAAVSMLIAVGVAAAFIRSDRDVGWTALLPMVVALVYAVADIVAFLLLRLRRLVTYALVSLAAGVLTQAWFPGGLGVGIVVCAAGFSWVCGGALALRAILRQPRSIEAQS